MKKVKLSLLTLIVGLMTSLYACRKFDLANDLAGQEWNPALAIPLLYTTVDIYDILKQADQKDIIVINENTGLLALSYEGDIQSFKPADIIVLNDQSDNFNISLPISTIPFSGSYTHSSSSTAAFSTVNGAEINTIVFHAGTFNVDLNTSFAGNVEMALHIPSLLLNGVAFRDTIRPGNGVSLNLSGYTFDLTKGTQGFNELIFNSQTTITASAGTSVPNPAAGISFSLSGMEFEEVTGDFKQQTVTVDQDSILLKLFGNLEDVGSLKFSNPQIFIRANNSFGFPVRLNMQDIYTYNIISGDTFKLFIDTNEAYFDITYPPFALKGDSAQSVKTINSKNSSVVKVVSPTPKYLVTNVNAISNPTGAPAQNFVTRDGFLKMTTELELPLEGNIENYSVRDTFPYEFSENIEEIDSILIRSNIRNGFPIDAWVQVYLTDENYNVLDSLFPSIQENIVLSGELNSKGRVDKSTTKITDVTYSQSRVQNITQAKHTILAGRLKTTNNGQDVVKIYDEYQISLKIGLMVFGAVKLGNEE